mmetsp:Transcript_12291/g.23870  ORF Transcript_12291/g.23870 Transcript_12291/m.23870 type:complete len:317 (+) Transcript_12291:60-1010(+)
MANASTGELTSVVEAPDTGAGLYDVGTADVGGSSPTSNSEVRFRSTGATAASKQAEKLREPVGELETEEWDAEDGDADNAVGLDCFWHRAACLVVLLMCQSTSSVILEHFDALIQSHPVVIYFLTMLVGAGGNVGGQSVVLVVRKLAIAAVRGRAPDDSGEQSVSGMGLIATEMWAGVQLAVVLAGAAFFRCAAFHVSALECLAICTSMFCIVSMSTIVGAGLPLLLKRLGMDPAHAGAAIQVAMDITGVTIACIVSCLILGVPLSKTQGHSATNMAAAHALAHGHAGSLSGMTIQREESRPLLGFGSHDDPTDPG